MQIDQNVKQVLVIRKDLNMIRGKEIAQGSHASNGPLCDINLESLNSNLPVRISESEISWVKGSQAIVCLAANDEEELHLIAKKAKEAGLRCSLILDEGRTQFGGVHTYTALSIGPDFIDKINPITGHLKLHVDSRKDKKSLQTQTKSKSDLIHIPSSTERVTGLVGSFIRESNTQMFESVLSGKQRSLIYLKEDVGYSVGDRIKLMEISEFNLPTGRELDLIITHVANASEKQAVALDEKIDVLSISILTK